MNIWRQIHDKHNISPIPYKLLNMETNSFMGILGWDILENSKPFPSIKAIILTCIFEIFEKEE